jgi:asparaginyl-tRNA synthetase
MRTPTRSIQQLLKEACKGPIPVEVKGWVRTIRAQKNVAFLSINDGSQVEPLQVVCKPESIKNISNGSSVVIQGDLHAVLRDDH